MLHACDAVIGKYIKYELSACWEGAREFIVDGVAEGILLFCL